MKDGRQLLPGGWQYRILAIAGAAVAGNLLMNVIPWPEGMLSAYEGAMKPAAESGVVFLWMTLVFAPVAEEVVFRLFVYGRLRRHMGFFAAAAASSLAFGFYHGNWIQGTYAFFIAMILAWGYETSEYHRLPMVILMHGAANLASLLVFGS